MKWIFWLLVTAATAVVTIILLIFTRNRNNVVPVKSSQSDPGVVPTESPPIDPKGPTLFTCTTYLALPGKYEQLTEALSSFFRHYDSDRIREFLVINEYDVEDTSDKVRTLEKQFPFITFIAKTPDQRGQPRSLNMILDYLRDNGYTYWIGFEESWYTIKPFAAEAHEVMEATDLGQLQFTSSWRGIPKQQIVEKPSYIEILPSHAYPPEWVGGDEVFWPLFSLRPGIDRVARLLENGYFDETPGKWPIAFEYDYSLKWVRDNRKGVLKNHAVDRSRDHVSTYSMRS
jgi:hypothetical protein